MCKDILKSQRASQWPVFLAATRWGSVSRVPMIAESVWFSERNINYGAFVVD